LSNKLGNRIDSKLTEKLIYAFTFGEQLCLQNLDFIFKYGIAILLATEIHKPFDMDVDNQIKELILEKTF
jgi:hypothetical protein